jgi:riboflavin synthase
MFTGLVQATGKVKELREAGEGLRIHLEAGRFFEDDRVGDSISVSGACLTIESFTEAGAEFFMAEETLDKTWFSELSKGQKVNLEKALKASERMGGHVVQGHVEAYVEVEEIEELEQGWNMTFRMPEGLENYIVDKGFIAVEGISLTLTEVTEESFSVTIIPETWKETNLSEKEESDQVNIETDVMARYAEKMIEKEA